MVSYVQPFPGCEILARNDTIRATERKKIKVDLLKNDYVSSGLPVLQKAGGGAAQVGDVIAQKKTAYGVLKLVLTADGKVEFVPGPAFDALKAGQVFKTKFTYTIADASGQLSTATINLSVKGVNNGPAVTALATSNQGQVIEAVDASSQDIRPITGNFLVRDLDRGDRLVGVINKVDVSYSGGVALPDGVQAALGNPAAFSVEPVTANGRSQVMRWTYDPAALNLDFLKAGETITIAFSVAVSDSRSTGATQVVRFTIVGTNDAPVADDDTFSILEDAPLVLDAASLVGDDTDLDRGEGGTALTITGVNAVNGGTVALVNGQVVFTPVANFNGVATFTYTISDGKGGTDTGTVTVNVAAVNDVAIIGDLPDAGVTEDETDPTLTATGTISVVDPDQGEAAFKTTVGSAEGNLGTFVLQANGQYVYTVDNAATQYLDAGEIRQETFTVTTIDGTSKSVTVTITGVNDDAVVVVTDVMDFETDGFFEFPALASFVESPLQDLPFAIVKSFLIADRVDQTDTDEQDQDEGAVDYVAGSGTITAITSTGGAQPPQGGEVAAFAFDPETGRVTYDRSAFNYLDGDQSVTYTITFQMKSGDDAPQTQTIKVTIEGRNDQASFVVGNPEAVTESDIPAPVAFNIKEYVSIFDADAQDAAAPVKYIAGSGTVVASSIVPPQGTTLTSLISFNAQTGQFSYDRKDFNWLNAGDTVTYTISFEAQSGDDGPVPLSILVTITGEDDTPVANDDAPIAENDALVTPEGAALSINAATLLANDTDADGDALEILSVNNPVNGSVSLTDGKILFTPAPDYYGPASFTYTVKDPSGRTDTATVTINVTPLSDKPVAVNDAASTQEGTSVTVDVLGNDTDADNLAPAAPNAGLTIDPASVLVTSGQGSATVVMVDGKPQIQFTPAGDFYGTATVSYVAVDADGNKSDAATVTVTVANVPDAPVANADAVTTSEDTPIAIDVLANDTDADNLAPAAPNAGLSIKAGSVAVVGGTAVGTATIADGKIVFTPATNYNGQATITYVATDGTSDSNQASVTVTVTPVNDAPDLPNGVLPAQQSPEDQTITVTKATLQAILAGPAFDVDNTNAQLDFVIVVKNAGVLIATIPVDGADPQGFTFTPPADFIGPLTVEVTATDPGGLSDTATFALAITPVNDAPVAVGETIIVVEDSPGFTIDVLANDVAGPANESAQVLTIKSATALNGTVTIVDGKLVYKPNANYNGADTITYVIEDNGTTNGAAAPKTAQATVAVTVSPANDAPVANNDSGSTSEDTAVTFTVGQLLANDSALPDTGEVLSVTGVGGAQNGTVS
ncbi:MAG TPA: Ig-like domain-containing protein, partial [Microvirga sp.]